MKQDKIPSGDEMFTKTTYNGVEILVRNSNGYVNASKMADGYPSKKNHITHFLNGADFTETIEIVLETLVEENVESRPTSVEDMKQVLMGGVDNKVKGAYVHPRLVHFVAEWVDKRYAVKVARIMDAINTGDRKALTDRADEMERENERLRQELKDLETDLEKKDGITQDLTTENDEIKTERRKLKKEKKVVEAEKEELKEEKYDKSVRSDLVLTRMYWVKLVKKDDGFYYVSHDQKEIPRIGGKLYAKFGFTAAGVIREDIRKHFHLTGPCPAVHEKELASLIAYIRSLNPKMEIFC